MDVFCPSPLHSFRHPTTLLSLLSSPSLPKSSCPSSLFLPYAIIFSTFISPSLPPLCNPPLPTFFFGCLSSHLPSILICFPSFHASMAPHPPFISPITHFLFLDHPHPSKCPHHLPFFPLPLAPSSISLLFILFHSAICGLSCDVDPGRFVPAPPPLHPVAELRLPGRGHSGGHYIRVLGQTVPPAAGSGGSGQHHFLPAERGFGPGHGGAGSQGVFSRGDPAGCRIQPPGAR